MNNIEKIIDQTFLKKDASDEQMIKIAEQTKEYNFRCLCVFPEYTKIVKDVLRDSDVMVTTLIDEPTGASLPEQRIKMAEKAKVDGSDEIDVVMKIDAFKNEKFDEVENDLKAICKILPTKVIIGSGYLTDEEIKKIAGIVKNSGAICIKTATIKSPLDHSELDEKAKHIKLMKEFASGLLVKAAGSVRTKADLEMMVEAGADIIGTSSGVEIINEEKGLEVQGQDDGRIIE